MSALALVAVGCIVAAGCATGGEPPSSSEDPSEANVVDVGQPITGACTMQTLAAPCDPDGNGGPKTECQGGCGLDVTGAVACIDLMTIGQPVTILNGSLCGGALSNNCGNTGMICNNGACINPAGNVPNGTACQATVGGSASFLCSGACFNGVCLALPNACPYGRGPVGATNCVLNTCVPQIATMCIQLPLLATTACDDANGCTGPMNEACDGMGVCVGGTAKVCNDNNACTTDACNPATGMCGFVNSVMCNDNNPCTDDSCDPATGMCGSTNNTAPCSDNNGCTVGDVCAGGACTPGGPKVCDDMNACTDDACNPLTGVCFGTPNMAMCSDNNACTTGDQCALGLCVPSGLVNCDDGDPCTTDTCSPASGCVHMPTNCDDNNACTSDSCGPNGCQHAAVVCNDGNPCTADLCNPANGCFATPVGNNTPCPDGNACNGAETCQNGTCTAGMPLVCNDNNACTIDSCSPAIGCTVQFAPSGTDCDADGNACNGTATCQAGTCVPGAPLPCDDGNPCTTDVCMGNACQSTNVANGMSCSDNNPCNGAETCQNGACTPGAPPSCDDNDACTVDACNPVTGCTNTAAPDGFDCDADGDACNGSATCQGGTCTNGPPLPCDDNNPCTTESCMAGACVIVTLPNGTPCPDGDFCNGNEACLAGACAPGTALDCDDGNVCTADTCTAASGCMSMPIADGVICDPDGNACNGSAACTAGTCVATPPMACDDGNPCTTEMCMGLNCDVTNVMDGTPCPDADPCNGVEACAAGVCAAGMPLICDDGDPCTIDSCDPLSGCQTAPDPSCGTGGGGTGGTGGGIGGTGGVGGGTGGVVGGTGGVVGGGGTGGSTQTGSNTGGTTVSASGGSTTTTTPTGGDGGGAGNFNNPVVAEGGCGCRAGAEPASRAWAACALLAGLLLRRRRRK